MFCHILDTLHSDVQLDNRVSSKTGINTSFILTALTCKTTHIKVKKSLCLGFVVDAGD